MPQSSQFQKRIPSIRKYLRNTMPQFALMMLIFVCLIAKTSAVDIEREPINYSKSTPDNPVSRLQNDLDSGKKKLKYDEEFGYLPSLLKELDVPTSSQSLVFSKTSLQRSRISPRSPRALYFNDDVYVGYCQNGEVLEVSVNDAKLGTVFYTLEQDSERPLKLTRQTDNCLLCHGSSRNEGLPGHLLRSVYTDNSGQPVLSLGSYHVDQTTPFNQRWGGWYVTGKHGKNVHLGNTIVSSKISHEREVDLKPGQNVTKLDKFVDKKDYVAPHSDIVALLVLEHQVGMHNQLTRARMNSVSALYDEAALNRELKKEPGHRWGSTTSRLNDAVKKLVEQTLFVDEATWSEKIECSNSFAREFAARGIKDSKGRSLRDFNLKKRMFKYPCSYLIYSESFDGLPDETKELFWKRMDEILSGRDQSKEFSQLSVDDRVAIREILIETKPGAKLTATK